MHEYMCVTRPIDFIDGCLKKVGVRLLILSKFHHLRKHLAARSRAFSEHRPHEGLFSAACRAYFEVHVVDGNRNVIIKDLTIYHKMDRHSATLLVEWVERNGPGGMPPRASAPITSEPLASAYSPGVASCGG